MILLLLTCLIVAQIGTVLALRKTGIRPGWERMLVTGLTSGVLSFVVAIALTVVTAPASLLTFVVTVIASLLISYFYAAHSTRPQDATAPARWRYLNPVIIGSGAILAAIFLFWTNLLIVSDKPVATNDVVKLFAWVLKSYFYPRSMLGDTPPGLTPRPPDPFWQYVGWAIWAVWLLAVFVSAQPYKPKLRIAGSILGVLAALLWTVMVIGTFIGAGLRH
jgi:hypothetical protein